MAIYPWEQSFWTERTIAGAVLLLVLSTATATSTGGVPFYLGQLFGLVVMLALIKNGILLVRNWTSD